MCKGPGAGGEQQAVRHMAPMQPSWASGQSQLFPEALGGGQFCGEGCSHVLYEGNWSELYGRSGRSSRAARPCHRLSPLPLCPHTLTNTDTSIKQLCAGSGFWIHMAP